MQKLICSHKDANCLHYAHKASEGQYTITGLLDWTGLDHDVIWRPGFQEVPFYFFFIFLFFACVCVHVCVCVVYMYVCVCVHTCVYCVCVCVYIVCMYVCVHVHVCCVCV